MDDSKIVSLDARRATSLTDIPAPLTALVPIIDIHFDTPPGFRRLPDGIYLVDPKDDQETSRLCSPLRVTALFRDSDGKGWGRLVEVDDLDGKTHVLQIEDANLTTKPGAVRSALASAGLHIADGPKASASVIKFLRASKPARKMLRTDRLGWVYKKRAAFVLANGRVIGSGEVLCSPGLMTADDRDAEAGTLEDWQTAVAARCVGNDLLILGVSLAFSGPLLELLGAEGGGLHLRGASSSGKSTILQAAASVWGGSHSVKSWRATANGLENEAARCNGKLLALDELAEVSAKEAFDAAYMLANGKGKSRATATGGAQRALQWRVAILSTGEISLAEKLAEGGRRSMAGQDVRLIDLDADTRLFGAFDEIHGLARASDFADTLKAAIASSFGTAGPAFVKRLIEGNADTALPGYIVKFRQSVRAAFPVLDGVGDRIVTRFALIAAAGEAATRFGITGWMSGHAHQAALRVLEEVLMRRHDLGPASQLAAASIERTRAFLVVHENDFADLKSGVALSVPGPIIGWRDGKSFMFTKEAWHELHDGFDPLASAKHLKEAGFLLPGEGSNMARKAPSSVPGRPRLYCVRDSLLAVSKF